VDGHHQLAVDRLTDTAHAEQTDAGQRDIDGLGRGTHNAATNMADQRAIRPKLDE
jgi:hypothetical protein